MDYPAPLVKIRDGKTLDLSDAYAKGLGAYDLLAIRYAYAQFPDGADTAKRLREIVHQGVADGLLFLSDADSRPAGAAHPLANLWDNGDDPVASLRHEMQVRAIGLERIWAQNPCRRGTAFRARSRGSCLYIFTTATSSRRP